MLRTTPESLREAQPLVSRGGDLVLTADARIDNRDDLIRVLCPPGSGSDAFTDAELILAAYERWGVTCPEHLLGAFAFAIWDGQNRRLYCARDHFGVRPFYYYAGPRLFGFGSEVKALFELQDVPRSINEARIADKLAYRADDVEHTFYRGIYRLPPAHWMVVGEDEVRTQRYWCLDPDREVTLGSDEAYAEAFHDHFKRAVQCRLRAVSPVGAMLSGGLDSSSVACMAQTIHAEQGASHSIHSFSALFDDVPASDERSYIEAALDAYPFHPHFVRGDRESPLVPFHERPKRRTQNGPIAAPNLHLNWSIYRLAEAHGVRCILDGFDGDTTVSHGVGTFHELAREGRWLALAREACGFGRLRDQSALKIWWRYLHHYRLRRIRGVGRMSQLWRRMTNSVSRKGNGERLLSSDFAERIGWTDRKRRLREGQKGVPSSERAHHHRLLTRGVLPATLETLDRASSVFGIEVRYPFFDRRLVEFCLGLPAEQKLRHGWSRRILRHGMKNVLPEAIRTRPGKSNVGPGFDHAFLATEKELAEHVLWDRPERIAEYVDLSYVREAYNEAVDEQRNDAQVLDVWNVVTLDLWLRLEEEGLEVPAI
jgi:asparagine synthase (glutamine-hydrolysing)